MPSALLNTSTTDNIESTFRNPAEATRPMAWWHWMHGNISREGITADLEAMKRVGLSGAIIFHVGLMPIRGDVAFQSEEWWALMRFAFHEAHRLGLKIGFHNCPGWSCAGGPWVTPEKSMQKVVWSKTHLEGPAKVDQILQQPETSHDFYRDIAVFACPDTADSVPVDRLINLSERMDARGRLEWEVPAGKWIVLRFGHTSTGKVNHPAPEGAEGLECDKLSAPIVREHFNAYAERLINEAGDLVGKTLTMLQMDSYEGGPQDWTPKFPEAFAEKFGYDPIPWLPVLAGVTIGSKNQSDRFLWDRDHLIKALFNQDFFDVLREMVDAHEGMTFLFEPYGKAVPFDSLTAGGRAGMLMAEFWKLPNPWGWRTLKLVASIAHTCGRTIVGAESFTALPFEAQWDEDPYSLKSSADRAFAMGVNLIVLHGIIHQPWMDAAPGLTMHHIGTHFGRKQTWWEMSGAFFDYLSRCQHLLQQGLSVADILYLNDPRPRANPPWGYAEDSCGEEVFLRDLAVKDGRLVLSHGQSYRLLVLPEGAAMTPAIARKVRQLVESGALVIGSRPDQSPSLQDFPACDKEVRKIADELWGEAGKVVADKSVEEVLAAQGIQPDFASAAGDVMWTHRTTGDAEIYFVSNQIEQERVIDCAFRVSGRQPELWDAATGEIRDAGAFVIAGGQTRLPIHLDSLGSVFVVFRRPTHASLAQGGNWDEFDTAQTIDGPWTVHFDPRWGGPETIHFDTLTDWTQRSEAGIRYYSGTAIYEKEFEWSGEGMTHQPIILDLGAVKNLAAVELNGVNLGVVWKPPFRVPVTGHIKPGPNRLVVRVANVWANRLIGDEQEPADIDWGPVEEVKGYREKPEPVGRPLQSLPDWFTQKQPRPSPGRYTLTTWNYFSKDSQLRSSGLLGPMELRVIRQ